MSQKNSESTTGKSGSKTDERLGLDLDHEVNPYAGPMPPEIAEQIRAEAAEKSRKDASRD